MAQQNILPGRAPIVWSTVDEAFQQINANFTELYLSIGGTGVDLSNIAASLIPDSNSVRDLGSAARRWKDIYLSGSSIYLGPAVITANLSGHVNLPIGSTVGGALIRNPDESSFKSVRVSGQDDVVANNFEGILNLTGNGISITTNAGSDTITLTNSGVTSISQGSGVSISNSTGAVTISNTGVLTATSAGNGIVIGGTSSNITIANSGVTQLTAGTGIVLSDTVGSITITNSSPNITQNVYRFVSVTGSPTLDPSGPTSTLNITTSGDGLSITANAISNTVTFSNTGVTSINLDDTFNITNSTGVVNLGLRSTIQRNLDGDVIGSVFADNSTMLIDGTEGKIVGPLFSSDGTSSIIMDLISGLQIVSSELIDIQGAAGAQIGIGAGTSGDVYLGNGSNSIIVNGTLLTSLIDTSDSSSIAIVPSAVFRSDVTVENDLIVRNLLTVQGNILGYTSTATLKNIVAASTDFADFQIRIAAL
jgi:autotransporter family porin